MRRLISFHLFKWRGVKLERETHLRGKTITKHWERQERGNHCDFRTPIKECFSDCNYGFVHHWIGLNFGQQILHMWYFKLFGWIVKKISGERDKYFTFSTLYFWISSSCLYYTTWRPVLIWLFVVHFSVLVGDSLVSLLIIVKLFLWSGRPVIFTLTLRGFSH